MGASGDIELIMRMQGWPEDVLAAEKQPQVTVVANNTPVGTFAPSTRWQQFRLIIPGAVQQGGDLRLELRASDTFTSTQRHVDTRPKGVRVANISLEGSAPPHVAAPELLPLVWLALSGVLLFLVLLLLTRRATAPLMLAILLICGLAMLLSVLRAWTVALLPWLTALLFVALLVVLAPLLVRLWILFVARFTRARALGYGLMAATLCWVVYIAVRFALAAPWPTTAPLRESWLDTAILGVTLVSALVLVLVYGKAGLPRACQSVVDLLASWRGGALAMAVFVLLWVGYEASVVASSPWVRPCRLCRQRCGCAQPRSWARRRGRLRHAILSSVSQHYASTGYMAAASAGLDRNVIHAVRHQQLGGENSEFGVHHAAGAHDLSHWRAAVGPVGWACRGYPGADKPLFLLPGDLHHD